MKILVAAVAFSSEMSGVQRHAFNAVRCLLTRPEISIAHLVVAPWQRALFQSTRFGEADRVRIHLAELGQDALCRNLWYYRTLPALATSLQVDLVHLTYPAPLHASAYACPTVVTLHDLYPYEIPDNFGLYKAIFNRMILQQCLRSADAIACVSETTRLRLGQYIPAQRQKAIRIFNCVETTCQGADNRQPNDTAISEFGAEQSNIVGWDFAPFLMCVAQHRSNKNIPLLVRTFAALLRSRRLNGAIKLLVVGIRGPETRRILSTIERCHLAGKVVLLDGLSETELQWCYEHCEAVVAPSITEGFGLPIAEALLAGCRVVCSDIPAFREVAEGCVRFVPLMRQPEESLANAIIETLAEPPRHPVTLPQFSARVLGAQYIALYRKLVASARSDATLQASDPERLPG